MREEFSRSRRDDCGVALLTVIWILALLAALVGSMAVTSFFHIRISDAISDVGRSTDLAESGLQVWMANLRADAIESENGVVPTELMSYYPEVSCPLVITRIIEDSGSDWVEVFNQGTMPATLGKLEEEHNGTRWTGSVTLNPGDYYVFGDATGMPEADVDTVTLSPRNNDEAFRISTPSGEVCDRVGWDLSGDNTDVSSDFFESEVVDSQSEVDIVRKTDHSGSPQDTRNNARDFAIEAKAAGRANPKTGFNAQPDMNEYIELYNTNRGAGSGDTVDVVSSIEIEDEAGPGPPGSSHSLQVHPQDPNPSDPNLYSGQVALVARPDINLRALGIDTAVKNGEVRLFTTGKPGFLSNDGLDNSTLEQIIVKRSGSDIDVLESGTWTDLPDSRVSRYKIPLRASDIEEHWPASGPGGTPGKISLGLDHHGEAWGWGGSIDGGTEFDRKIYLPSLENSRQPNDYGYFEFKHLEDETGKVDLLVPRMGSDTNQLTPEDGNDYRAMPAADAVEALQYAGDSLDINRTWLSYGDIFTNDTNSPPNPFLASSLNVWDDMTHIYTAYRRDHSEHVLNINTAPFEALKMIPIHGPPPNAPNYVTADMAKKIIEERSGDSPKTNDDGIYTSRAQTYGNNPADEGIRSHETICGELRSMHPNFTCEVFKQHTTLGSEGIFRAVVRGVALDATGDTIGRSVLEAVVDRRPVEKGTGPLKVLEKRIQ